MIYFKWKLEKDIFYNIKYVCILLTLDLYKIHKFIFSSDVIIVNNVY